MFDLEHHCYPKKRSFLELWQDANRTQTSRRCRIRQAVLVRRSKLCCGVLGLENGRGGWPQLWNTADSTAALREGSLWPHLGQGCSRTVLGVATNPLCQPEHPVEWWPWPSSSYQRAWRLYTYIESLYLKILEFYCTVYVKVNWMQLLNQVIPTRLNIGWKWWDLNSDTISYRVCKVSLEW